jgi:hypothetical protein
VLIELGQARAVRFDFFEQYIPYSYLRVGHWRYSCMEGRQIGQQLRKERVVYLGPSSQPLGGSSPTGAFI